MNNNAVSILFNIKGKKEDVDAFYQLVERGTEGDESIDIMPSDFFINMFASIPSALRSGVLSSVWGGHIEMARVIHYGTIDDDLYQYWVDRGYFDDGDMVQTIPGYTPPKTATEFKRDLVDGKVLDGHAKASVDAMTSRLNEFGYACWLDYSESEWGSRGAGRSASVHNDGDGSMQVELIMFDLPTGLISKAKSFFEDHHPELVLSVTHKLIPHHDHSTSIVIGLLSGMEDYDPRKHCRC